MGAQDLKDAIVGARPIRLEKDHYDRVIAEKSDRTLAYEGVLRPETGDAYFVKAGQVIRMEQRHDTTQIADWWWISPDLKTMGNPGATLGFDGAHLSTYSRVWSNSEECRIIATMVADEAPDDFVPEPHWSGHFWAYHCSPSWHQAGFPDLDVAFNACHVNAVHGFNRLPAVHAVEDLAERRALVDRLAERGNYQTFQPANVHGGGVDLFPSPAVPSGTGVEFYAEMDVYAVLSHCPWVDQSGKPGSVEAVPLYLSVWDTGIEPLPAVEWGDWKGAFYAAADAGEKDLSPRHPGSDHNA